MTRDPDSTKTAVARTHTTVPDGVPGRPCESTNESTLNQTVPLTIKNTWSRHLTFDRQLLDLRLHALNRISGTVHLTHTLPNEEEDRVRTNNPHFGPFAHLCHYVPHHVFDMVVVSSRFDYRFLTKSSLTRSKTQFGLIELNFDCQKPDQTSQTVRFSWRERFGKMFLEAGESTWSVRNLAQFEKYSWTPFF